MAIAEINGRRFGVEFEVGFDNPSLIRFVIDNIHSLERYRDYEFEGDEELNAEDPSREARLANQFNNVIKTKGKEYYDFSWNYFASNFIEKYYRFNGVGGNPIRVVSVILKARGYRDWVIHEDSSIDGFSHPMEFVTPPMPYNENSLKQVSSFCAWIQKYATVNESTGLHCHVEANDFVNNKAPQFLERIVLALFHYKSLETVFDNLVMQHRKANESYYAASLDEIEELLGNYRELVDTKEDDVDQIIQTLQSERYYKLNIHSLTKHQTLEFRQMHGTLNPVLVRNWIQVCVNFVNMVIDTEDMFLEMFTELRDIINGNTELEDPNNPNAASISEYEEQENRAEQALMDHDYYASMVGNKLFSIFAKTFNRLISSHEADVNPKYVESSVLAENIRQYLLTNKTIPGRSYAGIYFTGKTAPFNGAKDQDWYEWTISLTDVYEAIKACGMIDGVTHDKIEMDEFYAFFKAYLPGMSGGGQMVADHSKIVLSDTSKEIVVFLDRTILNLWFYRMNYITSYMPNYEPKSRVDAELKNKAQQAIANKLKQTQASLVKNTPGINKSRQMAQVAKQTARRPMAEDYDL